MGKDDGRRKLPVPHQTVHDAVTRTPENPDTDQSISLVYDILKTHLETRPPTSAEAESPGAAPPSAADRIFRTLRRINVCDFKGASRELDALPKAVFDDPAIQKLKALYPSHADDVPNTQCPGPEELESLRITPSQLKDSLKRMKSSAPGRSKIGAGHLKYLINMDKRTLAAFTNVANIMLLGLEGWDDPRLNRLTEARGIGLVKDALSGKLRPIGVNETFLNLVARIGLVRVKSKITSALHKHDFGFGKTGGTENIIQVTNALLRHRSKNGTPFILLQLDFENAFNSVFRSAIFKGLREKCPELLPFARFRYKDLRVFFEDASVQFQIDSKAGVSQGCPISPALFQLVMSEILSEVRKMPEAVVLSYLDDVCMIFLTVSDAWKALLDVKSRSEAIGLKLNIGKCRLIVIRPPTADTKLESDAMDNFLACRMPISFDGAEVLGAFVGTDDFVRDELRGKFKEFKERIGLFRQVVESEERSKGKDKGFARQKLLRYAHLCLNPIADYILRTTSPELTKDFTTGHDTEMVECFLSLTRNTKLFPHPTLVEFELQHRQGNPSPRTTISTARIFSSLGGAGFRSADQTRIPAYLGSIALVAPVVEEAFHHPGQDQVHDFRDLTRSCAAEIVAQNWFEEEATLDGLPVFPIFNRERQRRGVQRVLSQGLQRARQKKLSRIVDTFAAQGPTGRVYKSKYDGMKSMSSRAWIFVPLNRGNKQNWLRDEIIESELLKRIGEHPYVPKQCSMCSKQLIAENTPSEDHGVSCCAGTNGAASLVGGIAERAAMVAVRLFEDTAERKPNLDSLPCLGRIDPLASAKEFGDILSVACGRIVVIDVTFSSRTDMSMEALEEKKTKEYRVNRDYDPAHFVPFVLTATGAWGSRMIGYMSELKAFAQAVEGPGSSEWRVKQLSRQARETISLAICKANWVYLRSVREGYINIQSDRGPSRNNRSGRVNTPPDVTAL